MVRLSGVGKTFGTVPAVREVTLDLTPGVPVALSGPSGSGKTTLLRLIAGLETPATGEIHIGGRLASSPGYVLAPHQRGIGVVFQEPALWPHMTVEENIRMAARGPEAARRVRELLQETRLEALAKRRPGEISAGEAARAALARALAGRPRCLLLDEPLAHLDGDLKEIHLDLILRSAGGFGACLLYITHDPDEARRIGGRHLQMKAGRLE